MATEFEDGTWQSDETEVTPGRPRLFDEDMETISFRLPQSRIHAVDVVAKRQGISKSEFLRRAIDAALVSAG